MLVAFSLKKREMIVEQPLKKDDVVIEWTSDYEEQLDGQSYYRVSIDVSLSSSNDDVIPFFHWATVDLTKPKT